MHRMVQVLFFPFLLPIALSCILAWQWRMWGLGLVLATLAAALLLVPPLMWRAIRKDPHSDSLDLRDAYRLCLRPIFGITHAMGTRRLWVSLMAIPFEISSTRARLGFSAFTAIAVGVLVSTAWHFTMAAAVFIAIAGWTDAAVYELFYIFGFWLACDVVLGLFVLRQHGLSLRVRRIGWSECAARPDFQILHFSDLHFVSDDGSSRVEAWGKPPHGNAELLAAFDHYRDWMSAVDAVVLTGDITDAGRETEWKSFIGAWQQVPAEARVRCFIVPGNHDLNVVAPLQHALQKVGNSAIDERIAKEILFAKFVNELQGERCEVLPTIKAEDDVRPIPMSEWLGPHAAAVDSFLHSSRAEAPQVLAREISSRLFPYIWRTQTGDGKRVALVGVNTCGLSLGVATNAYGMGGNLIRLRAALKYLVSLGYFPVIVGHHDVFAKTIALPSQGLGSIKQRIFSSAMMFDNGAEFIKVLEECAPDGFLYLHGHRHIARSLSAHDSRTLPLFCSAPSLLFGDESAAAPRVRSALLQLSLSSAVSANAETNDAQVIFI
jgi:metallophosphoesterase superfamily enzyme